MPRPPYLARISLAGTISAAPDFAFGFACLAAWVAPEAVGVRWVGYLVVLLGLEFIVIHSAGFMQWVWIADWSRAYRVLYLIGLGLFYSAFAGILAYAARSWWPLASFWMLMLNRVLGTLLGQAPRGQELDLILHGWGGSLALYALAVVGAALLPVPAGGLTPDVVAALDFPGRNTWAPQTQSVLAAGYVYFTAVGISEMTNHAWVFRWMRNAGRRVLGSA